MLVKGTAESDSVTGYGILATKCEASINAGPPPAILSPALARKLVPAATPAACVLMPAWPLPDHAALAQTEMQACEASHVQRVPRLPKRPMHGVATTACRGKYWAGIRSACQPLFHSSSLASFAPLMTASAQKLAERCLGGAGASDTQGNGEPAAADTAPGRAFNLTDALGAFTLEVVGSTAFGCGSQADAS